ncbi:MAG TPA: hypothetical protein VMH34_04745, partial [Gammaproteobacteria bacterium]|nr:hypothetical protein [Gammaproteobacteria bacterium]
MFNRYLVTETSMDSVTAHAAYLKHLVHPPALQQVLEEQFGMIEDDSRTRSVEIAPFINQALLFR